MESVKPEPRVSNAELRRTIARIALAQAEIGTAVFGLLGDPEDFTLDLRKEMGVKVEGSVNNLLEIVRQLLDASDGD